MRVRLMGPRGGGTAKPAGRAGELAWDRFFHGCAKGALTPGSNTLCAVSEGLARAGLAPGLLAPTEN